MRITVLLLMLMIIAIGADVNASAAEQAAPRDIITSTDGASVRGQILAISSDGRISIKAEDGAVAEMNLLNVTRIILNAGREQPPVYLNGTVSLRLAAGSRITGKIKETSGETVVIENDYCTATVRLLGITGISFGTNRALPRIDGTSDAIVIIYQPALEVKCKVISIGDNKVKFKVGDTVHTALFEHVVGIAFARPDVPPGAREADGWYASVRMANGDRLAGTVEKMDGGALTLLTQYAGAVALKREAVERMSFSPTIAFSCGNLLISDAVGGRVVLFSDDGKELWEYRGACAGSDALELPSGRIIAVSDFADKLKALSSAGKEIGDIKPLLKRLESVTLLENGDYLVAEGAGGCLAEVTPDSHIVQRFFQGQIRTDPVVRTTFDGEALLVDGKDRVSRWSLAEKRMTWSLSVDGARGAADMGNGEIAVAGKDALIVFGRNGKEKWRAKADFPPYRRVGICVTRDGDILIPVVRREEGADPNIYTTVIVEYSPDGEKLREIPLEGRGFPVSSIQQSQQHSSRLPFSLPQSVVLSPILYAKFSPIDGNCFEAYGTGAALISSIAGREKKSTYLFLLDTPSKSPQNGGAVAKNNRCGICQLN